MGLIVAAAYAPTLDAEEETNDSARSGDMLIVAGVRDANFIPADLAKRHTLCKVTLGSRCANEDRLVNATF